MDWFFTITDSIYYIIPFLVVITVIVFIHELGHYIAAKCNGVKVDAFSIGFGPELIGWDDRHGTRWKVCLIPLGGYIQMAGDADASSKVDHGAMNAASGADKEQFIHTKTPWQKIVVAAAGPVANFILTFVLLAVVIAFYGKKEGDPAVGQLVAGGVAESMGLKAGDKIEQIEVLKEGQVVETHPVDHFRVIQKVTNKNAGNELRLSIDRDGEKMLLTGVPAALKDTSSVKMPVGVLGIMPVVRQYPLLQSIAESMAVTWDLSSRTLAAIGNMIIGKEDSSQLGGLFLMAKGAHDFFEQGLGSLLEFMAILSLNLGLINLFPIPMLDGGHIIFYLAEIVRGKPVSEQVQEIAFRIGFALLIGLMIFSHWNDIVRYGWFAQLKNLFS